MSKNIKEFDQGIVIALATFKDGTMVFRPSIIPHDACMDGDSWGLPLLYTYSTKELALSEAAKMVAWLGWKEKCKNETNVPKSGSPEQAGSPHCKHPSHVTRSSDSSLYDEICINCGAHDLAGGGWNTLAKPCKPVQKIYCLITDCGDGSATLRWFRNKEFATVIAEHENFYMNEGEPFEYVFPHDLDLTKCKFDFSDDCDWYKKIYQEVINNREEDEEMD